MENTKYELWVDVFLKDLTDIISSAKEGNLTVGRPTGSTGIRTRKTVYRYLVVSLGDGKIKKIEDEQIINEYIQLGKKKYLYQNNLPNYKRLLADINDLKEKKRITKDKGLSKVNLNRRAIEIALLLVKKEGFDSWFIDNGYESDEDEITEEIIRSKKQDRLKHSLDYSTVKIDEDGIEYKLTNHQSKVIRVLHEAFGTGMPDVRSAYIRKEANVPFNGLREVFKSRIGAWKALIVYDVHNRTYRLKL